MKINIRKAITSGSCAAPKKYGIILGVFLVLSVILELFVFNYKWIDSGSSTPIPLTPARTTESGFDGKAKSVLVFKDIDTEIKYIRISPGLKKGETAKITVSAIDEANSGYLSAPEHVIAGGVKASEYLRLHFSGEVKSLKIVFNDFEPDSATITELNTKVPLMVSWIRILFVFLLMSAIYILRPGSPVYKIKTDLTHGRQKIACIILFLVMSVSYSSISKWNTTALHWYKDNANHQQYYSVIEAFRSGQLSYIEEPSDELKALDNPYDYSERYRKGVKFKWDNAYYNGKYYSYFGVAPAILLYLPYNLITGENLPNSTALCIFGILTILGIMLLLWEIIKKWYRNTPFAVYLLLSAVIPFASALAYAAYKPDFYMVPPMAALMFASFGLALWISAEEPENKLKAWKLCLGAVCLALTAACRPQFLIAVVFGIILFWDHVFKKRALFSRSGTKQTIAICAPFVIIGAAVMWYNYARFGSPFDFGANYNLTSNDMTHRGFVMGRIGLGIFSYFLQPIRITPIFPFLHDFYCEATYQGLTLAEPLLGGVLMLYPLLFLGLYGAFRRKLFGQDKRIYGLVLSALILAVVTAVADAQMAGLLTRYFTDFVWMLMLGSVITVFALYERNIDKPETLRRTRTIILILSYATIALSLLSILAHSDQSIVRNNPYMFYKLQHLIAFWV
ncbi:MAG: hypothetical protein J1G06_06955 [Oscillospiraceae bacterium]|nr:hypothetical protein [Oscillospiraceae bacterium]